MKRELIEKGIQNDKGIALINMVLMGGVLMIVVLAILNMSSTDQRSAYSLRSRSSEYYKAETSIQKTLAWLRDNSKNMITPFLKNNFYGSFDISDPPVAGSNEGTLFSLPTKIKLDGTSESAILVNGAAGATASFPPTQNIDTGQAFDAESEFANADLGNSIVRVTLVSSVPDEASLDYGEGGPPPETDFKPVYRVDAMTALNGGAHLYAYIMGDLVTSTNGCVCDCHSRDVGSGDSESVSNDDGDSFSKAKSSSTPDPLCVDCNLKCESEKSGDDGSDGSGCSGSQCGNSGEGGGNSCHGSQCGSGNPTPTPTPDPYTTICYQPDSNPSVYHTITVKQSKVSDYEETGTVTNGPCATVDMSYHIVKMGQLYKP